MPLELSKMGRTPGPGVNRGEGALSGPQGDPQWRKCRIPVKTITMPCSLAASMDS